MLDEYFPLYIFIFLSTLILTAFFEKKLIPRLSEIAKQPIYEGGPRWHLKKLGTPTMGGVAFLIASLIVIIPSSLYFLFLKDSVTALSLTVSFIYAALNASIGIIDDLKKLKNKRNDGLTPKQKLLLQFGAAIIFLILRRILLNDSSEIGFSFGTVDLGPLYYPICVFVLLGIVNSANLTFGIDGLAASVEFAIGVSLFSSNISPKSSNLRPLPTLPKSELEGKAANRLLSFTHCTYFL